MKKNFFGWNVDDESFIGFPSKRILEVTEVVAQVFENNFGIDVKDDNLTIVNDIKADSPYTDRLVDKIYLSVTDNYPMKVIYQLAHEMLHYFLFDKTIEVPAKIRWIEETFCELSSILVIYILIKSSFGEEHFFANVTNNQAAQDYLDDILNKNKRFIGKIQLSPSVIYKRKKETLENNPYRRTLNCVFAVEIFDFIKNRSIKSFWQKARYFVKTYNINQEFASNFRLFGKPSFVSQMVKTFGSE